MYFSLEYDCGWGRHVARSSAIAAMAFALTACAFPRKDFSSVPDATVIRLEQDGPGYRAQAPDCQSLLQDSQYDKPDDLRMSIAFGCATYTNLAEQLAQPSDLIRTRGYGGQSAETAAKAVERYREGAITPLRETSTTNVGNQ